MTQAAAGRGPAGGGPPDAATAGPPAAASTSPWASLVAGPIAGVCSRFVIYPSDTIKARLQVQGLLQAGPLYKGTLDAVVQVARKEGLRAFYRGFGAVVVGNVPANMAYFGGYELGKHIAPGPGMLSGMSSGAVAQLAGSLLFTPVDIIKERMQVQGIMAQQLPYTGPWHALRSLVADRGPLGLLKGYWATNAVWIPWSIVHIAAYEQLKAWAAPYVLERNRPLDELPPWALGWCSAASASLASLATQPADVVKTRLQVLSASRTGPPVTALSVARQAWRTEGPQVFMSGALARVLTLAPGAAITWMIYEPVKRVLEAAAA